MSAPRVMARFSALGVRAKASCSAFLCHPAWLPRGASVSMIINIGQERVKHGARPCRITELVSASACAVTSIGLSPMARTTLLKAISANTMKALKVRRRARTTQLGAVAPCFGFCSRPRSKHDGGGRRLSGMHRANLERHYTFCLSILESAVLGRRLLPLRPFCDLHVVLPERYLHLMKPCPARAVVVRAGK
jgi:hypothetical protein